MSLQSSLRQVISHFGDQSHSPPAPHLLGHIPELRADPLGAVTRWMFAHRDLVRLRLGTNIVRMVFDPELVRLVLQAEHRHFDKNTRVFRSLKRLLGEGLVTADGDHWLRQRRMIQPAFRRRHIQRLIEPMQRASVSCAERWARMPENSVVDVAEEMMALTRDVIVEALFSSDLDGDPDQVAAAIEVLQREADQRFATALELPAWVPTPGNRRVQDARRQIDEPLLAMIAKRRRELDAATDDSDEPHDMLGLLLAARDSDTGARMSDEELRDEIVTLFVAGHETTASTLGWVWWMLSLHPGVAAAVMEELDEALGGRVPDNDDLEKLPLLHAVIEETLRLYPPVWSFGRAATKDMELGDELVPAHSHVIVSPWATHRHPDFWENPMGFDPHRFLNNPRANRPFYRYFPFGAGPRACVGANMALMEAQIVMAVLLQRFRLDLVPGHQVEPEPLITLRPRNGIRMTVHPRNSSQ